MRDETIKDKKYRKARCDSQPEIILPVPASLSELPPDYPDLLKQIKKVVATSRTHAIVAASAGMTMMYWQVGRMILARQDALKWGAKVIDRLSADLKKAFPGMAGFSPRNLKYMRKFAEAWPDEELVQRTVALIPWRDKNDTLVRYCLEGMKNPIGVSEWATTLEKTMPKEMRDVLPTIEQLESELADDGPAQPVKKRKGPSK